MIKIDRTVNKLIIFNSRLKVNSNKMINFI